MKVLIGYLSATGTTEETCTIIKEVLEKKGHSVTMMTMTGIKDIRPYDKVVLASPINGMSWLPEGKSFVEEHKAFLEEKEVVLIYLSYILKRGSRFWCNVIQKGMNKIAASIHADQVQGFGGKVSEPFGTFPRVIFGISKEADTDARDLEEVADFGETLCRQW